MNSRERVLRALYMEEPDMVPWFDGIDPRVLMKIFEDVKFNQKEIFDENILTSINFWEKIVQAETKLGIDVIFVSAIFIFVSAIYIIYYICLGDI